MTPQFHDRFRVVTFDLVGSGASDISEYEWNKYSALQGYADDLLEIIDAYSRTPVIFVGHSVCATIGLLAAIKAPTKFAVQVMVGPSPCYIDHENYIGGFSSDDIDDLLLAMEGNYLGWSSTMAPVIMGAPDQPTLGQELTNAFCRADPKILQHFARATFLSDHRSDVPRSTTPTLLLQSSDDLIAPIEVGEFMHQNMQNSTLCIIENVGHCPHLSEPAATSKSIHEFFAKTLDLQ